MSLSNVAQRPVALSSPTVPVTGSPATPAEKDVKWMGRTVYEAKREDSIRLLAIVSPVLIAVGLLLLSFMPITATLCLVVGALCAVSVYKRSREENHLENAIIHLVGSKEKIEQLSEVKLTKNKEGFDEIKCLTMVPHIARVTHQGKTHGVAFQYLEISPENKRTLNVKLYLFQEPFVTSSTQTSDPINYKYSSHTSMSAKDLLAYEKMIKDNRFIVE